MFPDSSFNCDANSDIDSISNNEKVGVTYLASVSNFNKFLARKPFKCYIRNSSISKSYTYDTVVPFIPSITPIHRSGPFCISHNSFSISFTKDGSDSDSDSDSDSHASSNANAISLKSIVSQLLMIQQTIMQVRTEVLPGIHVQLEHSSPFHT